MMKRTHYTKDLAPGQATISGWVSVVRDLGNVKFVILRDFYGIAQVTLKKGAVRDQLLDSVGKLNPEDVVTVQGSIVLRSNAPGGFELIPAELEVVSRSEPSLPVDISGKIESNLDVRLDWRVLDLRRQEVAAIFRIESKAVGAMQDYLEGKGFLHVFTPCLMGAASESGAEVFPVVYFEREAFLRQDPQLHRQLLIASGFDRLYDLGPNWRAEPSHTPRHICEHRACAAEFAFMEDESDMMRCEEDFVAYVLKRVADECEDDLKRLGKTVVQPKTPFPELRFPEVYEILAEAGKQVEFGEDYDRESEQVLASFVKREYDSDFFFVNRFPFAAKPFYVMRVEDDPQWARSVDLIYKGLEQSSGGQREHRYERIISQIREKGMNPENLEWFTKFFRYGVPPHGGFCLGVERLIMQLLDLGNVREAALFPRAPERLFP
jgi:nondiscriminating aspartyl-tRNA synthetase